MKFSTILSAVAMLAQQSVAHPGQSQAEAQKEIQQRQDYLSANKRTLVDCADQLKARGNDAMLQARRSAKLESLRRKRSISIDKPLLKARSLEQVLNTSHRSNLTGINPETADPATLFTGNASCTLYPETTEGPYWVSGEFIRDNITEDQPGIPFIVDIQVIDVHTCEAVPQVYTELWHANTTGVYSGISSYGNGDSTDTSNLNRTALRGLWPTDKDGVVTFESIFPGHYYGRAPHIHVITHLNAKVNDNNTLSGGNITHVGQFFFDQSLITETGKTTPYNTNTQELTLNEDDGILVEESAIIDPIVEYVYLGEDISEGLFGWISFGIDTSASQNVTAAAWLTPDGGVANPEGGPRFTPSSSGSSSLPTASASALVSA
ncbi:hypothetical protein SLS60_011630 [Paraconiothyrium brasiliense]|uniref:Intradiol ring-cleavage dioxygenases domain-containing protein n=1 Tax=Paraconiothyrium brasiliense TaxID=300254 RepID=A0ABR3QJC6_9PLEO